MRPIGVGEVSRQILSKAILSIIRSNIQDIAGSHQLFVGQKSGCEAATHALEELFEKDTTDGVLLIDASNAFNSLNGQAILMNVQRICPVFAATLMNTYRLEPSLFIGGETIHSREGTTQGNPLAMAMYAIGILPLILWLEHLANKIWYADDSLAGGNIKSLKMWWDKLQKLGPSFGSFINSTKSLLVVKEHCLEEAQSIFEDTGIQVTSAGGRYLG